MRRTPALLLLLTGLITTTGSTADRQAGQGSNAPDIVATSASTRWQLNAAALEALGISSTINGSDWTFHSQLGGTLALRFEGGARAKLAGGSLQFTGGPLLRWKGGQVDLRNFRIQPTPDALGRIDISDAEGVVWLSMHMGHREWPADGQRLAVHVADLRLSPAFAIALDRPQLSGQHIGSAELQATLAEPLQPKALSCPITWPTEPGAEADLEMIAMDHIEETVTSTSRDQGRVVITPSARFRVVGTADLPWYQVFATPGDDGVPEHTDDDDCLNDGSGNCQPYGNDQGGLLIWNFYRLADGRLEQIGRSGVKHAFNATNVNCPCFGGRVAFAGCEDDYGHVTNSNQNYLGYRSEVEAFPVLRKRVESVFDVNGDDVCDRLGNSFIRCLASAPDDEFDRRLHVDETALQTPGARYFMESWYLVRDDIDIFNSMGYQEVAPQFDGSMWDFPKVGSFVNGPVAQSMLAEAGFALQPIDTGEGQLLVASRTTGPASGPHRYQYAVMNFDFDRRIDAFSVSSHAEAGIASLLFSDGDGDAGNDWLADTTNTQVRWTAPGEGLDWGTLYLYEFQADDPGGCVAAQLGVGDPGGKVTDPIDLDLPGPDGELLFSSSFEAAPSCN